MISGGNCVRSGRYDIEADKSFPEKMLIASFQPEGILIGFFGNMRNRIIIILGPDALQFEVLRTEKPQIISQIS